MTDDCCLIRGKAGRGIHRSVSNGVHRRDEGVHVLLCVVSGEPKSLSVGWVRTPIVSLLLSIVNVGNTFHAVDHGKGVLPERDVRDVRLEPGVIMIANKAAEHSRVFELYPVVAERRRNVGQRSGCAVEGGIDRVEQRVVENAVHRVVLVGGDVGGISVQDFSDGMNTRGAYEIGPEVLSNMLDGVDSDGIEVIRRNERLYPSVVRADNGGILGVDVWESNVLVTQPASLDLSLIRVILDPAEAVEVSRGDVERAVGGVRLEVSCIGCSYVIDNLNILVRLRSSEI